MNLPLLTILLLPFGRRIRKWVNEGEPYRLKREIVRKLKHTWLTPR